MYNKIGVIGVGPIGIHFTQKLLDGGYTVTVHDLNQELVAKAVAKGASSASTSAELASKVEVIILALPGDKALKAVMEGENGLLSSITKGQILIDTGTSSPALDIHYVKECAALGAGFMEAPVTWRAPGLILIPAGDKALFDKVEDIIRCISYKYRYYGEAGRGQELKSVNQAYFSCRLAVEAEMVTYAKSLGFGSEDLDEFLEFGFNKRLYGDDFTRTSGTTELNYKDLLYAIGVAHESGAALPMSTAAYEAFKFATFHGGAKEDQNNIVKYWRALNGKGE